MELVPILMIVGALLSAVGSWLLFANSPPDIAANLTWDDYNNRPGAQRRRLLNRIGFFLLMLGSFANLAAGLVWYQQPARFG